MTQKERDLLLKLIPVFIQYDKKTAESVIKMLSSNDFYNYLEVTENLFSEKKNKTNKEPKADIDSYEKATAIKRITKLLKNYRAKIEDISEIYRKVFNNGFFLDSMADIENFLKNEPIDKIYKFETSLMEEYAKRDNNNSLDNWSTLIVKETPSNEQLD